MKGYVAVLTVLFGILVGMLFLRNDVEARILKVRGQLYEKLEDGKTIRNYYNYKIVNKTTEEIKNVTYKLISVKKGEIKNLTGDIITVPKQGLTEGKLYIDLPKYEIKDGRAKVKIGVYSGDKLIETTRVGFSGPRTFR